MIARGKSPVSKSNDTTSSHAIIEQSFCPDRRGGGMAALPAEHGPPFYPEVTTVDR